MKTLFKILILVIPLFAWAQNGPNVMCNNCEGASDTPIPVTGSWFNPEQPGTGYLLEVQNGRLVGYYFGYDENGDQEWLIFQGDLTLRSDDPEIIWSVEAPFTSFSDGNAFNQPHTLPTSEDSGDVINIEFTSINYAKVSVNGGDVQNMSAFTYGVGLSKYFDESDHLFPNLEGLWSFTYQINRPEVVRQQHLYENDILFINKGIVSEQAGVKFIDYTISKYYYSGEILFIGSIVCSNPINPSNSMRQVVCELNGFPNWYFQAVEYTDANMVVSLPNIGVNDFTAEFINPGDPFSGFTIKADRVNYIDNSDN